MRPRSSDALRESFFRFFEREGHQRVDSSGLIPANDPTLLFANAGMNQFKDVFLGREKRDYKTACSAQKCVRAGGKHNDLDNVGYTARHHTFFEMLGNFSFGDYFKQRAIALAWNFLTAELGIPVDRLYVTVFTDDDEAARIWHEEIGVASERIFRFGEKDNFWSMGDTGPCGPCSEIFYDFGPNADGPDDPFRGIESGSDRFMEVWNLVFMQYDRQADGSLVELPKPSVDTGMGLERLSAVVQGVLTNYETDLFHDIIRPMAALMELDSPFDRETEIALRVIADHLRAMTFLITDGVVPSNEGRGYVLRRIMRRAMRFGKQLGMQDPFLYKGIAFVVDKMGESYPQIVAERPQIETLVEVEEKQFDTTLSKGMPVLDKYLEQLSGDGADEVPGQVMYFLYGTHGFPVDLMEDIARDAGLELDHEGFKALLDEDARASSRDADFSAQADHPSLVKLAETLATEQRCHAGLEETGALKLILIDGDAVDRAKAGDEVDLVLDRTSFYAESGGQIGDRGTLTSETGTVDVVSTTKAVDRLVVHHGRVRRGEVGLGQKIEARVDTSNRRAVMKNHTATHLLHKALKDELGLHVRQAGSLVDADKLRFDFSHFSPVTAAQIGRIEDAVNARILANIALETQIMDLSEARASGAVALFGEKYADRVRVVSIDDYSKELCGGTHVGATGEIGVFKIVSERGLASGIRRIVAITGVSALQRYQETESILAEAGDRFGVARDQLIASMEKWQQDRKSLERQIEDLKMQLAKGGGGSESVHDLGRYHVLIKQVQGVSGGQLRQLADEMLDKIGQGVVLLGSDLGDSAQLVVKTNLAAKDVHAGNLVRDMAALVGGKGGGRPDMAMAGGKDVAQLAHALDHGLSELRSACASA